MPDAAQTPNSRRTPSFSFRHANTGGSPPHSFTPGNDAEAILGFICSVSSSTWQELGDMRTGDAGKRHRLHHEIPISSLPQAAQTSLSNRRLDEIVSDDLYRFRLNGTARLWGFREGDTFHVLWWDPDHEVYPSSKRHT